jgi:transcriptional regulator with PAS, ATPase and Fis domain
LAQALLDIQDEPFVLIDRDCRIVAANRAYADAYQVGEDSVVGRACHEVSHHSPRPCHENGESCPLQQVLSTGEIAEVVHIHYDRHNCAERVRLTGYPIRGKDGHLYLGERIFRLDDGVRHEPSSQMIGSSSAFLASLGRLAGAAKTSAPILLSGESGVGKELAAKFLHSHSARKSNPFFAIDCATFSHPLFESELFGHERGAFTGCVGRKKGLFELAHGGTLFLDEIGDIPYALQAKLLRVFETGEFRRVGGNDVLTADVRLITASNRNLPALIVAGLFRQDLYYRIAGIEIALPPLRARRADIPALAKALLDRAQVRGAKHPRLTAAALARLGSYDYPGNIRELRNIMLKAACLAGTGTIDARHIVFAEQAELGAQQWLRPTNHPCQVAAGPPVERTRCKMEAEQIAELLDRHNGHRTTVARIMGISERTLYRKLRLLGSDNCGAG